ncbi:MAG: bis(5'-nucleosyl)-tetraphosphatase (symmetrical) YqeK [Candidatus Goldiibacteriota bacterium]
MPDCIEKVIPADILKAVRKNVSAGTFAHIMGSCALGAEIACRYKLDKRKIILAGILHDIAKDFSDSKKVQYMRRYKIKKPDNPDLDVLLHGFIAAKITEKEFGIKDREIINAVKYHTTGKKKMNNTAKALFAADYIEEGRTHKGAARIRTIWRNDPEMTLDELVFDIISAKIRYVESVPKKVHENGIKLYNELIEKLNKK